MHLIPMVGGPFDGVVRRCVTTVPRQRIRVTMPAEPGVPVELRPRRHLYRLSACHKRYLHESIVGEG